MKSQSAHTVSFCYRSPLGLLRAEIEDGALSALRFVDVCPSLGDGGSSALPVAQQLCNWLDDYFRGKRPAALPPLSLGGTPFQRSVWNELLQIPYGQRVTYGEMARRIGCRSAQAVGQAVGRNPVVILVPCHRVVGAHGRLTGYAYGLNRKQQLLQLEKNIIGK